MDKIIEYVSTPIGRHKVIRNLQALALVGSAAVTVLLLSATFL